MLKRRGRLKDADRAQPGLGGSFLDVSSAYAWRRRLAGPFAKPRVVTMNDCARSQLRCVGIDSHPINTREKVGCVDWLRDVAVHA